MSTDVQAAGGFLLLVGVIAAIVVLALHGTITGTQAMTALMAIITLGGGAFAVHAGVSAGSKAAAAPTDPEKK